MVVVVDRVQMIKDDHDLQLENQKEIQVKIDKRLSNRIIFEMFNKFLLKKILFHSFIWLLNIF